MKNSLLQFKEILSNLEEAFSIKRNPLNLEKNSLFKNNLKLRVILSIAENSLYIISKVEKIYVSAKVLLN